MTLKFAGNPSFDPLRELRYKNKTKKVCGGGEGGGGFVLAYTAKISVDFMVK